ncbi:MAG TPA: hypothetical protein VFE55_22630 [Acidimicrobiia bacterium]|nr:hypothetical protein [Acidimicrobiia bacterium]
MPLRRWVLALVLAPAGIVTACTSPARPTVRSAAATASCADAVAAAFPGGHPGTLPAYREVERRCPTLQELARRKAFDGSVLRLDCAPADILAAAAGIPGLGRKIPAAPADLIGTPVCRQFNAECADYDELRRDHATLVRNPTMANLGLFVHHQALYEGCLKRYG